MTSAHLLFVCTGNLCRSPVAERLTALWAERALGPEAGQLRVSSAGTDAEAGRSIHPSSKHALLALGGDPTGFRSQPLVPGQDADLVLTMTRRQRHVVLTGSPRAMRHTFTLPEAADLLGSADLSGLAGLPLDERVRELARRLDAGRRHRSGSTADDVPDPIGKSQAVHDAVAADIARHLQPITAALFVPATAPLATGRA